MAGRTLPRGFHSLGYLAAVCCGLAAPATAQARIVGRVLHIGYQTSRGDVIRAGAWTPIVVELVLDGQGTFEGSLRVAQPDRDGDLASDRVRVQLRGDAPRRYVLYSVAALRSGGDVDFSIDVLDGDDNVVEIVRDGKLTRSLRPGQQPEVLGRSDCLILDLSGDTKGRIGELEAPDLQEAYDRPIRVAHSSPRDLPDLWPGIEMVDCIVWDGADATDLTPMQLDALVAWVRQGGQLLIAAAETADTIAASKQLAEILPVKIGRVITRDRLPALRRRLGVPPGDDPKDESWEHFRKPISMVQCDTAPGSSVEVLEEGPEAIVIARRTVERGQVTFVAAELKRILADKEAKPVRFFERTLRLWKNRAQEGVVTLPLFGYLENTVAFRRRTGLYLLGAILFSIAYVGTATFGSWWFLNQRGWTRHAWSAFAAVAGVAAVLSVVSVQAMRGVGQSLHQLSIVDATVGDPAATATAFFGLKTGTYSWVDAWLPSDYAQQTDPARTTCFLKPMPSGAGAYAASSSYVDPARYRSVPASAVLEGVPIRATLKQFEGRWSGRLRRMIEADISVAGRPNRDGRRDPMISDGSTITNNLGHALTNCYLLQSLSNAFSAAGVPGQLRDDWILVHPLGSIADGERIDLARRVYVDPKTGGPAALDNKWFENRKLKEFHAEWAKDFPSALGILGGGSKVLDARLEQYQNALLMLTTLSAHEPVNMQTSFSAAGFDFWRHPCRQLDRCDDLTTDRMMLIGFAPERGPVMLCTRTGSRAFKPLRPEQAYTMYRFSIPVTRE